jgi:malate dehydrogenase (oxaloacetate-decarboxylating)(NADP+)
MGAGAAAIASMKLLLKMGLKKSNIYMFDSKGLISKSRKDLNEYKEYFKQDTTIKDIKEIISEIDVFIGLSKGNILDKESLRKMPKNPIVFALANPIPEINPDIANKIRNDLIIATGRSDYPNQINNLICFPYIFRGLLDVNATEINDQILVSLVNGIRKIVKEIPNKSLYPNLTICSFGKDYIIPKPMDPRLIKELPSIISNTALRKNNAV